MANPLYTTLFLIGLLGLLAQILLGFHGHAGHGHDASHAGHGHDAALHAGHGHDAALHAGHGHDAAGHAGHGHVAEHGSHHAAQGAQERGISPLWTLFSPLTVFSICLGTGAVGLILRRLHLGYFVTLACAIAGGLVFYGFVVRPIWSLIFQFASRPSRALEGAVAGTAEAMTRFSNGQGIVRLTIDGQIVRVLAYQDPDDRAAGVTVEPGDSLLVTQVDGARNTCRVSRL